MNDHLISLLEREIASIKHSILNGACNDFVVYREQVASLRAYEAAVNLTKKAFLEDEDDDKP